METEFLKYFLAANSAEGFVSHFTNNYNYKDGWRAYIIKGGPGTGKSSFMKYVAAKAVDKGFGVELCPCSSDPDSLDGVIVKDIKVIILDGTLPHAIEPKYVGFCEEIINLGAFWNGEKLRKKAKEIINLTEQNKKLHKTASAYISAAGEMLCDNFKLSNNFISNKKCENFARSLAVRLLPPKNNNTSQEWVRFIGGVTPKGIITFKNTVEQFYKNVIVVDDKYGAVANTIMQLVRKTALSRGYEIITLKNPILPSKIIDHILIPELSLALVREYDYANFSENYRRIHSRRFYDTNVLRTHRTRITFNRRVARELLLGAIDTLYKAKAVHDDLERHYIEAMNFGELTALVKEKTKEILTYNYT